MFPPLKSKKALFSIAVIIIIVLNLYTLSVAYTTMNHTLNLGGADLPRDFSVYYVAAWRMFHDPSQIFNTHILNNGEPAITPPITPYKYTPSFLVLISPLLTLNYYQAFWIFDAIQFIMLPLMAFLLYKLLEKNHPAVALVVLVAVLVLPYPMTGRGLSVSYFMSWAEGQAKILLAFLLLLSFYFGYKGKAVLSGIVFGLGAFDPRFALLALPLFLFYSRSKLKPALIAMITTLAAFNAMALYPGVAQGFIAMLSTAGGTTPFYTPSWIPLAMIVCLVAVNSKSMVNEIKQRVYYAQRKGHSER
jgi:Glycosyltransferase family 87